jgi:hypothetical protein
MEPSTSIEHADAAPANPLSELIPVREWVKLHGQPIFSSYDSFDWFVRQHQEQFAQCEHWVITGRGKYCGPGMAAFVRELLQEETKKKMANRDARGGEEEPRRRGRPRKIIS